ncbi:MAG: phosphoribosylformylglycinamidine cyclo-ligase, partial [Neisseria sp.]|nr:phosphoribosylformylglycinamidine cyclo-ligase [Neisseria sp.]
RATDVIKGIAQGCEESGCALIGGETAEMPGMYPEGEYDLAGFAVGVVEKDRVINGRSIVPGDIVLGLASNGAHSNGYSLVRKIIDRDQPDLDAPFDNGKTLREAVIAPTRLYVKPILAALQQFEIKGMAHITGGGITENVPRVLPENTVAQIDAKSWEMPKLFQWLQQAGNVEQQEMYRTFNCGIGMVVIVAAEQADAVQKFLAEQGETVYRLGVIRERNGGEHQTQVA